VPVLAVALQPQRALEQRGLELRVERLVASLVEHQAASQIGAASSESAGAVLAVLEQNIAEKAPDQYQEVLVEVPQVSEVFPLLEVAFAAAATSDVEEDPLDPCV
jgi:hypothetical protein